MIADSENQLCFPLLCEIMQLLTHHRETKMSLFNRQQVKTVYLVTVNGSVRGYFDTKEEAQMHVGYLESIGVIGKISPAVCY